MSFEIKVVRGGRTIRTLSPYPTRKAALKDAQALADAAGKGTKVFVDKASRRNPGGDCGCSSKKTPRKNSRHVLPDGRAWYEADDVQKAYARAKQVLAPHVDQLLEYINNNSGVRFTTSGIGGGFSSLDIGHGASVDFTHRVPRSKGGGFYTITVMVSGEQDLVKVRVFPAQARRSTVVDSGDYADLSDPVRLFRFVSIIKQPKQRPSLTETRARRRAAESAARRAKAMRSRKRSSEVPSNQLRMFNPARFFAIVDVSEPGGRWADGRKLYTRAELDQADARALELERMTGAQHQVIDAAYYEPARQVAIKTGLKTNPDHEFTVEDVLFSIVSAISDSHGDVETRTYFVDFDHEEMPAVKDALSQGLIRIVEADPRGRSIEVGLTRAGWDAITPQLSGPVYYRSRRTRLQTKNPAHDDLSDLSDADLLELYSVHGWNPHWKAAAAAEIQRRTGRPVSEGYQLLSKQVNPMAFPLPETWRLNPRRQNHDDRLFHESIPEYNLEVVAGEGGELSESDIERARYIASQVRRGIEEAADVCQLSPPVCAGNMGIPRSQMPQLTETPLAEMLASDDPGERLKAQAALEVGGDPTNPLSVFDQFVQRLKSEGVQFTREQIPVGELKATQREIKAGKTFGMADAFLRGRFRPQDAEILVSSDGHILDGHHRYASLLTAQPDIRMNILRVSMPMREFLEESFRQPGVFRADVQGNIISPTEPLNLSGRDTAPAGSLPPPNWRAVQRSA